MTKALWFPTAKALLSVLMVFTFSQAEEAKISAPPEGYDVRLEGIEHGKVELIEYESQSVGMKRKARVYTPPGIFDREEISSALPAPWDWRRRARVVSPGDTRSDTR